MNRNLGITAFVLGLVAVVWVGSGHVGSNPLALAMTALIGAFYLMGALELRRFHQATSTLAAALACVPENLPSLDDWLGRVHPSLRNAVRQRIEGERAGLPGPVMTPYLVGLLVLLGMLGTFLGMVVTLNGAVLALESTTDLPTIRAALAAPVKGLGLAFGTSVAGVAASAMLGLVSALCRRERLQAVQLLDTRVATVLRVFSQAHQRQETLKTLHVQARVLPEVADRLQAMMVQIERHNLDSNARLLASQEGFQRHTQARLAELAAAVGLSLKESLAEGARLAGATLQPVVEATMTGLASQTALLHEKTADAARLQLEGLAARFGSTVTGMAEVWTDALARQERGAEGLNQRLRQSLEDFNQSFTQSSSSLLAAVDRSQAVLRVDLAANEQQRLDSLTGSLASMAENQQREWQHQAALALGQQEQICRTLEQTAHDIHAQARAHAGETISELASLAQAAAQAPRAAADVMAAMRQTLADSAARDNDLLDERARLMAALATLLDSMNHAATAQRAAIDALVASTSTVLQQVGARFTEKTEAEAGKMSAAAAQITGSAVEVASIGEAFGLAVQRYGESNEALMSHLRRLESSLSQSTARSDEQLAYYVAQAREVIDLSLLSQKQIIEDMRQLADRQARLAGEAA